MGQPDAHQRIQAVCGELIRRRTESLAKAMNPKEWPKVRQWRGGYARSCNDAILLLTGEDKALA